MHIGSSTSHYRIVAKLGESGMGVVYKAEDTKLNGQVALKFLAADLANDAEAKGRFLNEAKAAATLHADPGRQQQDNNRGRRSSIGQNARA